MQEEKSVGQGGEGLTLAFPLPRPAFTDPFLMAADARNGPVVVASVAVVEMCQIDACSAPPISLACDAGFSYASKFYLHVGRI